MSYLTDNTVLVKMIHGSHLYGLNTPSSDKDYKSVFVPSLESMFLHGPNQNQNISTKLGSDSKNTSDDVDTEDFSLGQFIKHLCSGEMLAVDMLHSRKEHWLFYTPHWEYLVKIRDQLFILSLPLLLIAITITPIFIIGCGVLAPILMPIIFICALRGDKYWKRYIYFYMQNVFLPIYTYLKLVWGKD